MAVSACPKPNAYIITQKTKKKMEDNATKTSAQKANAMRELAAVFSANNLGPKPRKSK